MNTSKRTGALSLLAITALFAVPTRAEEAPLDSTIDYWVQSALRDSEVPEADVSVSTKDGVVTLQGTVDTLAAKKYAVLEAEKVNGVLGVVDRIVVDPEWKSDADIRYGVRRRLLSSALVDADGLAVDAQDGTVTLSGDVPSYNEREEAELLATEVRGVHAVKNELRVRWQTARSDEEIQRDATAALERDVYLSGMPVTASVEDGIVTLSGNVGNAYEKRRAADAVRWIPHVEGVHNDLAVTYWENRGVRQHAQQPSDADLRAAVRKCLEQDPRVKAGEIQVTTSYGHVTLDGSVLSHWEVQKAEEDARDVVGVSWVTNNLFARVDQRDDASVRSDVEYNLSTDAVTEGLGLSVDVRKGIATLSGDAHTWYQRTHAQDVASRVHGVRDVVNDISVQSTNWKSDAEIADQIQSKLEWNWSTWWVHGDIHVTVDDGIVTLVGDVNHWSQRKEAEGVALRTKGVTAVDDRLTVKGVDYPWDEWHDKGMLRFAPSAELDGPDVGN